MAAMTASADNNAGGNSALDNGKGSEKSKGITTDLINAMGRPDSTKTSRWSAAQASSAGRTSGPRVGPRSIGP